MKQTKQLILKVLKNEARLWNEDKTELNQTKLLDTLDNFGNKENDLYENIISLLLQEKELKDEFFIKIKDVYVFKTNDFRFFMEENKIDNSYTAYKNRIGLSDGKRFLKDTNDVVLDFPYKDCVLEGGQSSEEGLDTYFEYSEKSEEYEEKKSKRKEIFFNQVLAHDEIDRLFDKKALVNWKRYTKDGEKEVGEIKRDGNGIIRENFIIKGNNLIALHSLKEQYAGKIKLIYIDPPYNTGGEGNTFAYNNTFNHSTWLTFIKNRIEISKDLLRQDGVICIAIDDEEYAHLKVLADNIYGRENYLGTIVVQSNPRGRTINSQFATCHEYCLFYAKNKNSALINNIDLTEEQKKDFKYQDENGYYRFLPFRRSGGTSTPGERPNSEFSLYYSNESKKIVAVGGERLNDKTELYKPKFILTLDNDLNIIKNNPEEYLDKNKNIIEILPIDTSGKRRVWRWSDRYEILKSARNSDFNITLDSSKYTVQLKDRIKNGRKIKTIWFDSKYDASSSGTILLKKIFEGEKIFSYPKSIHTVIDTCRIVTSKKDDIILDFFGGSGTTAHALLELNKEDNGNRKFIIVEQMDYVNKVTSQRVQRVIKLEDINDSFVYCELAKWNETAKKQILECKSLDELNKLFDEMYDKYFLNYNLKIKEFKEKVSKEEEFKKLSLDDQKKLFIAMLDNNQMYVNETEMEDKRYGISELDKKTTSKFYYDKQ